VKTGMQSMWHNKTATYIAKECTCTYIQCFAYIVICILIASPFIGCCESAFSLYQLYSNLLSFLPDWHHQYQVVNYLRRCPKVPFSLSVPLIPFNIIRYSSLFHQTKCHKVFLPAEGLWLHFP